MRESRIELAETEATNANEKLSTIFQRATQIHGRQRHEYVTYVYVVLNI